MSDTSNREEWKRIAEAITRETDTEKMTQLVEQLLDAFERAQKPGSKTNRRNEVEPLNIPDVPDPQGPEPSA